MSSESSLQNTRRIAARVVLAISAVAATAALAAPAFADTGTPAQADEISAAHDNRHRDHHPGSRHGNHRNHQAPLLNNYRPTFPLPRTGSW
ncbi:hypothetical protein FEK33_21190 [Nocardia asteroides NBRC 15531]|uniref:Uncharacterized protein n=1 Tax=Nocardia asteroides NBRC 15531 TaxID=1110697 RepID=U5EA57_NOCAS|nr:hypothetical protein [Nocardia asteroides]TLF64182.1 hypothetical protein FEK33_21190 [Nocardia asteroides NBRC 15531]UGT50714.1 hypothetical protein LT345_09290 [Nocardia asteroides]SFN29992.1 hypothetical protein SAMN05444423_10816 [Nocardia asteroides]VEG36450.1 Uncharacterised protein [Nocardia asteroides]GAD83358.1 hypothetical protein NCAST_19_00600 [Nocardia asteroides NBRC 15531]